MRLATRVVAVRTRRTKPAAGGPRKGYIVPRAETSSVVFGHEPRLSASRGLLSCESGVFRAKHGAPIHPSSTVVRVSETTACFGLCARRFTSRPTTLELPRVNDRAATYGTKMRPTDLCLPTKTCLPAPALVVLVLPIVVEG